MVDHEAIARVSITATMARYATSVDSGDAVGVAGTFTENARLEVSSGAVIHGRIAIEAFYDKVIGPGRPDRQAGAAVPLLRHNLTTSRIEMDSPSRARGRTYFMTMSAFGLDHAGLYTDVFRCEEGHWLLDDRTITVEWFAPGSWYQQVRLKSRSPSPS
ncbi:MAG: hypothetical protein RLZ83_38 [Pseudomonadota bacterium]|jgi:hypothetical protein